MDLAGPSLRQRRRGEEPHPRVARRMSADDRGRRIGRAVVHHQNLHRHARAGERGVDGGADIVRLVAGRDQDRDEDVGLRRTAAASRAGCADSTSSERERKSRQRQEDEAEHRHEERPSCDGSKRRPRSIAASRRQPS